MSSNLQKYKAEEIAKINAKFNSDMAQLRNNYNANISLIQRSKLDYYGKKRALNNLLIQFNRNVTNLRNQRAANIKRINAIQTLPQIVVPIPVTTPIRQPNKSALLVGINYINTPYELSGCINDVTTIKNLLEQQYNYTNTTLLTDHTNKKPIKRNILDEFTTLVKNSLSGDHLFFQYSGHGSYTYDKSGDEKDGQDETIVALDIQEITDDEIRKIIMDNIKPGVSLFALFDSCFSGTVMDLKYNYLDSDNYNNLTINNNMSDTSGKVLMISGCMDSQTSADATFTENNKIVYQGAMTWAFLNSLKQNTSNNLTLKVLVENMRTLLKESSFSQIPQLSSGTAIDINTETFSI
jgi:hypothetical protein